MVHSLLQTPEIIAIICEMIYLTRDGGFDHHRTLATMAKVSRIFRFWAQKFLWTNLDSLLPLIMSLPKDSWSIDEEEPGHPTLEIEDFVAKSSKVTRLTLPRRALPWEDEPPHKAEFLRVAPEACAMLHDAALTAGHVLFPNLKAITVLDPCPGLEPLYRDFGPNLVEVNIDLNLHMEENNIWKTFVCHLPRQNPGIRSLKIDVAPEDVLRNTICALPRLERLETHSFPTTEGLQHLGTLDILRSLTSKLHPFPPLSQWLTPFTFVALQHLACECDNIDD
ncbi:hypothetical protein C0995_016598, partial [Termitomyces sp. Mi166